MTTLDISHWRALAARHWQVFLRQFDDLEALRKRLDYQTYALAACALVASLLLGVGDAATRGAIRDRQAEDLRLTLEQVLPKALYDNALLAHPHQIDNTLSATGQEMTEVYVARRQGELTAVAFRLVATGGYAGSISLMMGVDRDGKLLGTRVIAHSETPGLGDKVETAKSGWILAFSGRSLDNTPLSGWRVKKDGGDFDQFAGATITPRAVVRGVRQGLEFYQAHRLELLASKP